MTQEVNPMQRLHPARLAPNHIRAVFRTSAAFFEMPTKATFEDLADRLCRLAERRDEPLTRIEVDTLQARELRKARVVAMRQLIGIEGMLDGASG
jgi:hypothetical protein